MPDVVNVQHTRGGSSGIDATPLSNGQILFDHEAKRIFLDVIVDEELVRIAMKEGTFTGTELEWNALTDAQKAVFTYVNITDDYEAHSDVFEGATASTDGKVGLVTRPMAGDQDKFLKGDGTWESVGSASDMTGATASTNGIHGLAPQPLAGDQNKVLCGDGTWRAFVPSYFEVSGENATFYPGTIGQ